jgi:hypothetical protein
MPPGEYVCCPAEYSEINSSAKTCHRAWDDWVCPVAWSPDPTGLPRCSPTNWPPAQHAEDLTRSRGDETRPRGRVGKTRS